MMSKKDWGKNVQTNVKSSPSKSGAFLVRYGDFRIFDSCNLQNLSS